MVGKLVVVVVMVSADWASFSRCAIAQQHVTVHYNSGLYLIDKVAIAGLTYESDSYRKVNRAVGDQTMAPTFVTPSPRGTWENVPLSKIRSRPAKILFDWVFSDTKAYWSLPLRVKPFLTNEESVHPAYAAKTLNKQSVSYQPKGCARKKEDMNRSGQRRHDLMTITKERKILFITEAEDIK